MCRFAALLLMAFAAPLSAADSIWALQQAIADRVSALEYDRPHSKEIGQKLYQHRDDGKPALLRERRPPHLTATIWSSGCIHGERWLSEAYPELIAKGWRVDVRRVSPDSGIACPAFTMGTRTWSGYTSKVSHFAALRDNPSRPVRYERGIALAPGETLVAIDGVPVERQKAYTDPVPAQTHHKVPAGFHSHRCRNCGYSWTHHDSNAGNASAHRCANCGRYEYAKSAVGGSVYRSGGCPGGVCGTRSWGLFR